MTRLAWRFAPFAELTAREVHDLFQLRVAAFVIEQNCVFQDLDGIDPDCWHLLGHELGPGLRRGDESLEEQRLVAYCRFLPPGTKFAEPSIGRIVTAGSVRGTGLGKELVREALARAQELWPGSAIRIAAQKHLERFYGEFGFRTASEPYDDDGIVHIDMLRPASTEPEKRGRKVGQN
jgi:ElaA protein